VPAVSAASIIAKVARDRYMQTIAAQYPQFGFDRHVGYGTAEHLLALKNFGITPEHRQSYRPIRLIMGV
jgi:ribonuclease HII